MEISIIIPTLNEEKNLSKLLPYLKESSKEYPIEIIVSDGGSQDNTQTIAHSYKATWIKSKKTSRAVQMNLGALKASGKILYFVHADTTPPASFATDILNAVEEGFHIGRYQSSYLTQHPLLKLNAYLTRYNWKVCRGGDQTLFVCKKVFEDLQGYSEKYLLMEEYELLDRATKNYRLKVFPKASLISARKYENNSYFKVSFANFLIYKLYHLGYPQEKLLTLYKKLLK